MSSEKTLTFQKEYQTLKQIAEELQSQEIDDVDELIKKVEQGTKSYKLCKERLDLAKQKLASILQETERNEPAGSKLESTDTNIPHQATDDTIPF